MVGAGGAGMTAALAAASHGLDTVLRREERVLRRVHRAQRRRRLDPRQLRAQGRRTGRRPAAVEALPRVDRRRRRAARSGATPTSTADPRSWTSSASAPRCGSPGCPSTPTTTPRRPAVARAGRSVEPVPMDARFLGDELESAAPAVHEGTRQPDRHPGRLPQDQPRPAHRARPDHDGQGADPADGQPAPRPEDVRHGQRPGHRPAPGARRRGRAGSLRDRADRPRHRGRPRGRRPGRAGRRRARGPRPPRGDPRQRRLREEPRDAPEVPALAHLGRLDDRVASSTPAAASWPASRPARTPTCSTTPGGARPSRSPAARGSAWPSATCPARSS